MKRLAVLALLGLAACRKSSGPATAVMHAGKLDLFFDLEAGTLSVRDGARDLIRGAAIVVDVDDGAGGATRLSSQRHRCALPDTALASCAVDDGLVVTVKGGTRRDVTTVQLALTARRSYRLLWAGLSTRGVNNSGALPDVDGAKLRVIDDGVAAAYDDTAEARWGNAYDVLWPHGFREKVGWPEATWVSDARHALVDPARKTLVAGFALPRLSLPYAEQGGIWRLGEPFLPDGRDLAAGETLPLDEMDFAWADDPNDALASFSRATADAAGKTGWLQRGLRPPAIWSSETGGKASGGWGDGIDEATVLSELAIARDELVPFGLDTFTVGEGWESCPGSGEPDARFPRGMGALLADIAAAGLRPGLFASPFAASPGCGFSGAHPDWLAPRTPMLSVVYGGDVLDLALPDALAAAAGAVASRAASGARSAPFGNLLAAAAVRPVPVFRTALASARAAAGADGYVVAEGPVALVAPIADGVRVGPKLSPSWNDQAPLHSGSLVGGARSALNRASWGEVAVPHPGQLFFRAPLTADESRAFATLESILGGAVELGDRLIDLDADRMNAVRRLLPPVAVQPRVLDLADREIPERVLAKLDGLDGPYVAVALFNWSAGWDLTTRRRDDSPVSFALPLAEAGLAGKPVLAWEQWTETLLDPAAPIEVPPHAARLVLLRPALDRPQLLGTNRHLLGEAADHVSLTWDSAARSLTGSFRGAAGKAFPFEYRLAFALPSGWSAVAADVPGAVAAPVLETVGAVAHLKFTLAASGPATFTVRFFR